MLVPPNDLDERKLRRMVEHRYGRAERRLEFVPVGEDSWSYRFGDLWVSVRRDLRGHVPAAYEGVRELHASGMDFVLAPLADAEGRVVHETGDHLVVVFPYLSATPLDRAPRDRRDPARVAELLSRVHAARVSAPIPTETYSLPFDDDLDLALEIAEGPPLSGGPFAPRLQSLLRRRRDELLALRAEYHDLAGRCVGADPQRALTHGEPISSNVLRAPSGLVIIDWGELMWGPPERDWVHVSRTLGAEITGRPEFLRLYNIRWVLSEIAEYTVELSGDHRGDADDVAMWERLLRYLPA